MGRTKKILIILGIIVAGIVIFRGYQVIKARQVQKSDEVKKVPVNVQPVQLGNIRDIIYFNGDIKAQDEVDVFPKVPGKLVENRVKEGDQVKKDQVVAMVDRDITGMKYELSEVAAPISGTIAKVFNDPGAGLSPPTMSMSMGTPIVRIVRVDKVKVLIDIPEYQTSKLKKDLSAQIKVDAFPDREFPGRVSMITPVVDPLTRTTRAEIEIPNPGHLLRPGMFARVNLIVNEKKNLMIAPVRAVLKIESKDYAFVIENGIAKRKELKLGIREEEKVEVISGLSRGEDLVTVGQEMLTDGSAVEIIKD
ncbi:MAG: efflux RND transporter periplasmic adaptor subunit [bacterium]|nr:efflux RND transporter periplasmic adaptor subunit [bacterium]